MRKLFVLAVAAVMTMPAFAAVLDSDAMPVTLTIDNYATLDTPVAAAVANITAPGSVVTGAGSINYKTNCAATLSVGALTDALVGPGTGGSSYVLNNGGAVLDWSVTPTSVSLLAGAAGTQSITVSAWTGTSWKDAYAGAYSGSVTLTISAP